VQEQDHFGQNNSMEKKLPVQDSMLIAQGTWKWKISLYLILICSSQDVTWFAANRLP